MEYDGNLIVVREFFPSAILIDENRWRTISVDWWIHLIVVNRTSAPTVLFFIGLFAFSLVPPKRESIDEDRLAVDSILYLPVEDFLMDVLGKTLEKDFLISAKINISNIFIQNPDCNTIFFAQM